jgi:hypothetical protein
MDVTRRPAPRSTRTRGAWPPGNHPQARAVERADRTGYRVKGVPALFALSRCNNGVVERLPGDTGGSRVVTRLPDGTGFEACTPCGILRDYPLPASP